MNIILDEANKLPSCNDNFINFESDYSPAYYIYSNGLVNTRLRYPLNNGKNYVYCRLNWWQRQKLSYIERKSWFHKHPLQTMALIVNIIVGIINIIVGFANYRLNIDSSDRKALEQQTELPMQKFELPQKYLVPIDSLIEGEQDSIRDSVMTQDK